MGDDILEALDNGKLTIGELQRSAKNICRFILNAPVMKRPLRPLEEVKAYEPLQGAGSEGANGEGDISIVPEDKVSQKIYVNRHGRQTEHAEDLPCGIKTGILRDQNRGCETEA